MAAPEDRDDQDEPPRQEHSIDWLRVCEALRTRIHRQLGTCGEADLADLVHEGVIDLLRVMRKETVHNLDGLIVVVARRLAFDEIRRRRRHRARFVEPQTSLVRIEDICAPPTDRDEVREQLWFLMLEFFRRERLSCLPLALKYQEVGDWNRVAETLGKSPEAVRKQWSRCARHFAEIVNQNPDLYQDWLGDG